MDDFMKELEAAQIHREFADRFGSRWSEEVGERLRETLVGQGIDVSVEQIKEYLDSLQSPTAKEQFPKFPSIPKPQLKKETVKSVAPEHVPTEDLSASFFEERKAVPAHPQLVELPMAAEEILVAEPMPDEFLGGDFEEIISQSSRPESPEAEEALPAEPMSENFLTSGEEVEEILQPSETIGEVLHAEPMDPLEPVFEETLSSSPEATTESGFEGILPSRPPEDILGLVPAGPFSEDEASSPEGSKQISEEALLAEPVSESFLESGDKGLFQIPEEYMAEDTLAAEPVSQDILEVADSPENQFDAVKYTEAIPLPETEIRVRDKKDHAVPVGPQENLDELPSIFESPSAGEMALPAEPLMEELAEIIEPIAEPPAALESPEEERPLAEEIEKLVGEVVSETRATPAEPEVWEEILDSAPPEVTPELAVLEEGPSPQPETVETGESKTDEAWDNYEKAKKAADSGDVREALHLVERSLYLNPQIPGAEEYRAQLQAELQKNQEESAARLQSQGEQFWQERRFPEAISAWSELAEAGPEIVEKISRAEQYLQQARQLWENAQFLADSDKERDAMSVLKECLNVYPYHESALQLLSQLEGQIADRESRLRELFAAGQRHLQAKEFRQAKSCWDEAGKTLPNPSAALEDWLEKTGDMLFEAIISSGKQCLDNGMYQQAREIWLQGKELFPENAQIVVKLAQCEEKLAAMDDLCRQAQSFYDQFDLARAEEAVGACLGMDREHPQANLLSKAIQDARAKERQYCKIVEEGDNFFNTGDFSKAINIWEEGLGLIPDDAELQNKIVQAHRSLGKAVEERQEYQSFMKRAQQLEADGNYRDALQLMQTIGKKQWECETKDLSADIQRVEELLTAQQNSQKASETLKKATRSLKRDKIHETQEILADEIFEKPLEEDTKREVEQLRQECEQTAHKMARLRKIVAAVLIVLVGLWQLQAVRPSVREHLPLPEHTHTSTPEPKPKDVVTPGDKSAVLREYHASLAGKLSDLENALEIYEDFPQPLQNKELAEETRQVLLTARRELESVAAEIAVPVAAERQLQSGIFDSILKACEDLEIAQESHARKTLGNLQEKLELLQEKKPKLEEGLASLTKSGEAPESVTSFVRNVERQEAKLQTVADDLSDALRKADFARYGKLIQDAGTIKTPSGSSFREIEVLITAMTAHGELKHGLGRIKNAGKEFRDGIDRMKKDYPPEMGYAKVPEEVTAFVKRIADVEKKAQPTVEEFSKALKKGETAKYQSLLKKQESAQKTVPTDAEIAKIRQMLRDAMSANADLSKKAAFLEEKQKEEWERLNAGIGKKILGNWYTQAEGTLTQYASIPVAQLIGNMAKEARPMGTRLHQKILQFSRQFQKFSQRIETLEWRLEQLRRSGVDMEQELKQRRARSIMPAEIRRIDTLRNYLRSPKIEIEAGEWLAQLQSAKKKLDGELAGKKVAEETLRAISFAAERIMESFEESYQGLNSEVTILENLKK